MFLILLLQKFDDFDVDASEVLQFVLQLNNHKLNQTLSSPAAANSTSQSTFDSVLELYNKFCQNCNVLDILDVFNRVKAWLSGLSQEEDVRNKCVYAMLQWPKNELEVEYLVKRVIKFKTFGGRVHSKGVFGHCGKSTPSRGVFGHLSRLITSLSHIL